MQLSMEASDVPAWCVTFESRLWGKSEAAYKALLITDTQYAALKPKQLVALRAIDAVLAGELLSCISNTTERGKLLHAEVAKCERDAPGSTTNSARAIYKLVRATVTPSSSAALHKLEADLKEPFFQDGMSATQVKAAALKSQV